MKQKIIFSDELYAENLVYMSDKDRWKCKIKAYYKKDHYYAESESIWFTIFFSKKGEIDFSESKDNLFLQIFLDEIRFLYSFRTYFERCKEAIIDIRELQLFVPNEFAYFHYNFDEKIGRFRFKDSLVSYEFGLVPKEGIEEIQIVHGEHRAHTPRVIVLEKAKKILDEEQLNMLNDMIKEKLKLRYLF